MRCLVVLAALLVGCHASSLASDRDSNFDFPISLRVPDFKGLAGKIIVLDPGHGGRESGAVGPAGTPEKVVNLAVSHALARRLRDGGAVVHLTRDGDHEVAPIEAGLNQDLQARSDLANRTAADLFLSIHHNATLGEKTTARSATETYYKMDDLGASLEAASSIHRWLVRGFELPTEALIPGNYAVLRNARMAAVLGEAAYITNPESEKMLSTPDGVAREAESYFYGVCEYFAPGVPKISSLSVDYEADPLRPLVIARVSGGGSPLDPHSLGLEIAGARERPVLRGDTVAWRAPTPLPNGEHAVKLWLRNLAGRTSNPASSSIRISAKAASLGLVPALTHPPIGGPLPVIISVTDTLGRPVSDGTKVSLNASGGELAQAEILTRSGQVTAYLVRIPAGGITLTAQTGEARNSLAIAGATRPVLMGLVTGRGGIPLDGVQILATGTTGAAASRSNREGLWWIPRVPGGLRELRILAPGYREEIVTAQSPAFRWTQLEPVAGNWVNQTVAIDPEGGDARHSTRRFRSQEANWRVATFLKENFEVAGARVVLTRRPDEAPSDVVRVRIANAANPALYIRIGHQLGGGARSRAEHYPSSKVGERLAKRISRNLAESLGTDDEGAVPSTIYPLIQTSSLAIAIYPSGLEALPDQGIEARCRLEAYAIFRSLVPEPPNGARVIVRVVWDEKPMADAMVRMDGAWLGQTGPDGSWSFPGTFPGDHLLTLDDGRHSRQVRVVGLVAGEQREVVIHLDRPEVPEDLGHLAPHPPICGIVSS